MILDALETSPCLTNVLAKIRIATDSFNDDDSFGVRLADFGFNQRFEKNRLGIGSQSWSL